MQSKDIKGFMDITDLSQSTKFLWVINELLELKIEVDALKSLVELHYDSYAIQAAIEATGKKQYYQQIQAELMRGTAAIKVAQDNPEIALRAALDAKIKMR